ncbi:MAG: hypothetical protein AB7Q81_23260 [Gammaproteobacteria bacterium]
MITNDDMRYHLEGMAKLTDERTRHHWAETLYIPFAVPERALFGNAYLMARPGVGVITSDVKVFEGLGRSRFDALYTDNQTQLPAPADFRAFELPSGMEVDLSAGPERYHVSYEGVDDTRFEIEATAIMPAYDIHDPAMDPMARKSYEDQAGNSGYGAAYGGHYDQLCRIRGSLTVRGRAFDIDYVDCMDRSWGVRPEIGLQPMAWLHAIFGADYAFHGIWSMNYAGGRDAQHTFAHGFVLENGRVHGCTAAAIKVERDGVWGAHYDITAIDERGTTHRFLGAPIASGLWEPYGCVGVPNLLCRFVAADGRVGYGENQEGWFYDAYQKLRAAGKL